MTCTKTGPKNDPFFNCRRKTKELSKKELSNVVPASKWSGDAEMLKSLNVAKAKIVIISNNHEWIPFKDFFTMLKVIVTKKHHFILKPV